MDGRCRETGKQGTTRYQTEQRNRNRKWNDVGRRLRSSMKGWIADAEKPESRERRVPNGAEEPQPEVERREASGLRSSMKGWIVDAEKPQSRERRGTKRSRGTATGSGTTWGVGMRSQSLVVLCFYLYTLFDMAALHFQDLDTEEYGRKEASLSLRDILPLNPKQYDKHRAPKYLGQPTIVYFHVTVLSLDSINEESMTYVADIFLAQSWRDSRLRLPENMSEEYRILDVDWLHNIWRPDCFFKNAKKVTFHEMSIPNHYLWLYHDKTLLYMSKLTLVLSCAMKFESYPHDTQICSMMIESLSHTTQDLVFIWNMTDPLVVNPEIELPQLDISNNYTTDCTIEYSTGNFTCIQIVFNLRRRLGYHLFHTYIPSALIVVMSWIAFWIKPEAIPARVTLGVTSLLTLATQNTQSQQSLPPVSYVKAIDVWMSSCSVFVFLSLMEFAVVNNYMGPIATKAMKGYSDEDLREAIDEFKTPMRPDSERSRSPVRQPTVQYDTCCQGRATAIYIDKFSRFFFPFSFFILNVVYWSTFL